MTKIAKTIFEFSLQNQREGASGSGEGRGGRERHNSDRFEHHLRGPPPIPPAIQRQESSPPQLGQY